MSRETGQQCPGGQRLAGAGGERARHGRGHVRNRMPKPTVLSLFTGAGGLDYGFEAAGFDVAAAVEIDPDCCETFRRHSSASVIARSVFDVPTEQLLGVAALRPGDADVLIAGPPCQPFS